MSSYTAKTADALRKIGATLLEKIANEFALVQAALASLDGSNVKNLAESDVIGGLTLTYMIPLAAGANGNTDITVTHKIRVTDVRLVLKGAGVTSATYQVKNSTNAITDKMAASGSDQAVVRCASLDDAYWDIAAGGTLRVTGADGATQPAALVFVRAVRVA